MILKVFAVRDNKAMAFLHPFYSNSVGSALRAFGDAVNDVNCPFNKHPEDYVLYEIAAYDDNTAEIECVNPIRLLACATDFKVVSGADKVVERFKELKENPEQMLTVGELNGKKS